MDVEASMKPPGNRHKQRVHATNPVYKTSFGKCFHGKSETILASLNNKDLRGGIDLIFTSPPFPLNKKKKYGNLQGSEYISWLAGFAKVFSQILKPTGSIVMEMGNAWEPGSPSMSPLSLKALLAFLEAGKFHLCQQFIWNNPARLPSPAQWVTVERIRVKDSFTHLWWMSSSPRPKANNRNVLREYSDSMRDLLRRQKYNSGTRPSEHKIGVESFLTNNGGAIPSNVITLSNTSANGSYVEYCREKKLTLHPARMPADLAKFFIKFLTETGDVVLDPFAGSNTTGAAAESLGRHWISIEADKQYIRGSRGRFPEVC
jgi:DNA modification methylase